MREQVWFRPAVPADAPELKRLNDAFNGPGAKTAVQMAGDLAAPKGERVFVAGIGKRLIGFCCCQVKHSFCYETDTVEITELYVMPKFRRLGVGKGLLREAAVFFAKQPIEALELLTGDDNLNAQEFYQVMGFSPSGELHYRRRLDGENGKIGEEETALH